MKSIKKKKKMRRETKCGTWHIKFFLTVSREVNQEIKS